MDIFHNPVTDGKCRIKVLKTRPTHRRIIAKANHPDEGVMIVREHMVPVCAPTHNGLIYPPELMGSYRHRREIRSQIEIYADTWRHLAKGLPVLVARNIIDNANALFGYRGSQSMEYWEYIADAYDEYTTNLY